MRSILAVCAFAAFGNAASAQATSPARQSTDSMHLSRRQAIAEALVRNAQLEIAREQTAQARARKTLEGLLAPQVRDRFEAAMAVREAEGRTEVIAFAHPPRTDLESSEVEGDLARIRVRFLGEFESRTTGKDGKETTEERRTAETWTFERNLSSRDPNWTLVRVDAAEA